MGHSFNDLVDLYETSVRQYASRKLFGVRLQSGWSWLSYRDFGSQVSALAGALRKRGLERGDRIAIIAHNSPEWAVAAFAGFGLGAVVVPVYAGQLEEDWHHIMHDAQPRWVMAGDAEVAQAVLELVGDLDEPPTVICFSERNPPGTESLRAVLSSGMDQGGALVHPQPTDLCLVLYTSGTTGKPKGVELTHRNIASNLTALSEIFPIDENDVSLAFLPWAHAFGQVVELYGMFAMGASIALAQSEADLMENMRQVRPTVLLSVPKLFNRLYDSLHERVYSEGWVRRRMFRDGLDNARTIRRVRLSGRSRGIADLKAKFYDRYIFERVRSQFGGRVRYAISGGAPLAPEVAELVDSLGITLYEGYGLTETSPIVSANWPGARRLGSVGKPLPNVRVEIDTSVDSDDQRGGEIVVHGPNVMRGYHHLPDETALVMTEDGGFRTGDIGYIDDMGYLFVTGRIKEQYKLENGRYVVPSPLEEELKVSRMIRSVMLHGVGRPYNVALVVVEPEALTAWADSNGLGTGSLAALFRHPKVHALYERELERHSRRFRGYEKVGDFALIERDFCVEDGTMTLTLKLRRDAIAERYSQLIDDLYGVHRGPRVAVE